MNEWKPYLNDRLIKECEGFYVIKPVEERQIVPLSCPVCDYLMRTVDDEKSYREFECCESCETFWARPRFPSWKEGWRPTKEQVQEKLGGRKKITVNMLF
jgi:hypothetical protein